MFTAKCGEAPITCFQNRATIAEEGSNEALRSFKLKLEEKQMAKYIKSKMADEKLQAADEKVRETVAAIIADVAKRGDMAVRETSARLDKWSRPICWVKRNMVRILQPS
jgi:hypothetical protein